MRTARGIFVLIVFAGADHGAAARAADRVDLLLVLAADVSTSVNVEKFQLQREGYAAAIVNPRVLGAIASGLSQRIAVCFIEWSSRYRQKVVVDWTLIKDAESARRFGYQIADAPRSFAGRTSISSAIDFSATQFDHAPYRSRRRTIDVSGDGTNNSGRSVSEARDETVEKGITINGLAILTDTPPAWNSDHTHPPGGLEHYYVNNVIGGPGSFVMAAESFRSFGHAIVQKLTVEIAEAGRTRPRRAAR